MDEYREWGHEKCVKMILDRLGDNPIYVTFDLDCLDPTVAPGVANIEPAYKDLIWMRQENLFNV